MTDGCPQAPNVTALIDGELGPDEAELTRAHLAHCEACATQLEWDMQMSVRLSTLVLPDRRAKRVWVGGSAVLGGGLLGAMLVGPLGGLVGMAIGYAAFRAAYGRVR